MVLVFQLNNNRTEKTEVNGIQVSFEDFLASGKVFMGWLTLKCYRRRKNESEIQGS